MKKEKETFTYLYLKFDIALAKWIIEGTPRELECIEPGPAWSMLVHIDKEHAMTTDVTKPLIVAQIVLDRQVVALLIDGHHRNYKAFKTGVKEVPVHLLTVKETFQIMTTGVTHKYQQMLREAKEIGEVA
jgi:hypothetical protein